MCGEGLGRVWRDIPALSFFSTLDWSISDAACPVEFQSQIESTCLTDLVFLLLSSLFIPYGDTKLVHMEMKGTFCESQKK